VNARGTGLVIHHDQRNENFLLTDSLPKPKGARKAGPSEFVPKTVAHRQYHYFDQSIVRERQNGCTGYSCETAMATAQPFNKDLITGDEWYRLNQLFDRINGRNYGPDGGATVTAAMEVGRSLGVFSEYRWAYMIRTMQEAILRGILIAGTYWYPSMFRRDAEGIVRVPGPNDSAGDLGHQYVIRKYDSRRDIWWVPNTWGDGDYGIPGDLMYRLVREEGEISQPTEIKLPTKKADVLAFRQKVTTLLTEWGAKAA
jgi:hypothetical protein